MPHIGDLLEGRDKSEQPEKKSSTKGGKMESKAYRQGEIVFIPVELTKPKESREIIQGWSKVAGNVIREGEVSGHKHVVEGEGELQVMEQRVIRDSHYNTLDQLPAGQMFITAKNEIRITHPEHKTLRLPKGEYVVRIQREYDEEKDRQVAD